MLAVSDLSKSYDPQILFQKVNFSLQPREKVGLIGPNGSGKTTLLKILAGEENPSSGTVQRTAGLRIGYLPQGFAWQENQTIADVLGASMLSSQELENELGELSKELAHNPEDELLIQRYDELLQRLQDGSLQENKIVLEKLGLGQYQARDRLSVLSGGQKTRLALAQVLLAQPQLLLLDEPTNHLDVAMLEWLENWLTGSSSAALIVSHDRAFLDQVITRILEIDERQHAIHSYAGNYSAYLQQRRGEMDKRLAAYADQ